MTEPAAFPVFFLGVALVVLAIALAFFAVVILGGTMRGKQPLKLRRSTVFDDSQPLDIRLLNASNGLNNRRPR